jgi:hypothetical protein
MCYGQPYCDDRNRDLSREAQAQELGPFRPVEQFCEQTKKCDVLERLLRVVTDELVRTRIAQRGN